MPLSNHLTYRDDLDPRCGNVKGGYLKLFPACHPKAGLTAFYEAGVLYVSCKKCLEPVTALAIAREPESVALSE